MYAELYSRIPSRHADEVTCNRVTRGMLAIPYAIKLNTFSVVFSECRSFAIVIDWQILH